MRIALALLAGLIASPAIPEWDASSPMAVIMAQQSIVARPVHDVTARSGRAEVRALVANEATRQGVPVALAYAVTHVESRFRCDAIGPQTRHGRARGPLQIIASSARALGFGGADSELASCGAGLRYGMAHLRRCLDLAGGDNARAATCHVQGWGRDPSRPVNAYARAYRGWVMAALPAADASGWLSRGTVAAPWVAERGGA